MTDSVHFETNPNEALDLLWQVESTPASFGDAESRRFEFNSRGDRVPGRLRLPPSGNGKTPLVLLQHGLGGSKESAYLEAAAPWVRSGAAVATIDFPLHGERHSAKLSERLLAAEPDDSLAQMLWLEFARQAVLDLRRTLDALTPLPELDGERIVYGGFSLGGMLGALFCAVDERPRAAALALAGGGLFPQAIDPCHYVGRIAPRPVQFINANGDTRVPRSAAEALHAAAVDPQEAHWFDGTHDQLPGVALKKMWEFLRDTLALDG